MRIIWEMSIRELDEEEEGWTTAFTDGSGPDNNAVGGFCANLNRLDKKQPGLSGNQYLGIKATHFNGELRGWPWHCRGTTTRI